MSYTIRSGILDLGGSRTAVYADDRWIADFPNEPAAREFIRAYELLGQLSRMTDPSDLRNSTDPCDDAVETLSAICLQARGILGLPQEFDHATATCERCGFRIDPENVTEDTCDCKPEPFESCAKTMDAYTKTEHDRAIEAHRPNCPARESEEGTDDDPVRFCWRCGAECMDSGACENDHVDERDIYCVYCGERIFEENPPDGANAR